MLNLQYKLEDTPTFEAGTSVEIDALFHLIERKDGVVCKFHGCWDEDSAIAFSLSFKECIKKNYQYKNWSLIKDISDWREVSDEAVEVLEDLIAWAEEHGQVANADIYEGDRSFEVFSSMYAKELLSTVHYRKFDDIDTGMVWLKRLGFNLVSDAKNKPYLIN